MNITDIKVTDRIAIASKLIKFPVTEAFMVKGVGTKMMPNISTGDTLICQKATLEDVESGDIVVLQHKSMNVRYIRRVRKLHYAKGPELILETIATHEFDAMDKFEVLGIVRAKITYNI